MGSKPRRVTLSVKNRLARPVWSIVWWLLYRPSPKPFHFWRRFLLRLFGAKVAAAAHPYPTAVVWAPWNLEMGFASCLANGVECYSVEQGHPGGPRYGQPVQPSLYGQSRLHRSRYALDCGAHRPGIAVLGLHRGLCRSGSYHWRGSGRGGPGGCISRRAAPGGRRRQPGPSDQTPADEGSNSLVAGWRFGSQAFGPRSLFGLELDSTLPSQGNRKKT